MKIQETATFLYLLSKLSKNDRYNPENPFAKILMGKADTDIVYEDKYAVAFESTGRQTKKHFLVIPKVPAVDLHDLMKKTSSEEVDGYMRAIDEVARQQGMTRRQQLMNGVSDWGYRVTFNIAGLGRQTVPHCHAHVMGGEQLQPHFIGITQEKVDKLKEGVAQEAVSSVLEKLQAEGIVSRDAQTAQRIQNILAHMNLRTRE